MLGGPKFATSSLSNVYADLSLNIGQIDGKYIVRIVKGGRA